MKEKDLNRLLKASAKYRDNPKIKDMYSRYCSKLNQRLAEFSEDSRVNESCATLDTTESIGLTFSIADLIENNNFKSLQLTRHFRRHVTMMRFYILDGDYKQAEIRFFHLSGQILTFFALGIVLGNQRQIKWMAGALVDSFKRQQDTWALEDDYMSAMLYQLAVCIKNDSFVRADDAPPIDIVSAVFSSSSKELFIENLMKCSEFRYDNAYRGVVNRKMNEFYESLAISYIPLEIMACEILYNQFNSTDVCIDHPSILPQFRGIIGSDTEYSDDYIKLVEHDIRQIFKVEPWPE